jgi:hypothetical protein
LLVSEGDRVAEEQGNSVMSKRELEKLLYQAVADALGVEAAKGKGVDRSRREDADHDHRAAA